MMTETQTKETQTKPGEPVPGKPVPVFSGDGRRMATIKGRVFEKSIDGTKHFLRRPPAIAMDAWVFDNYAQEFDHICILDRETGTKYQISRADFETNRFEVARGYGTQSSAGPGRACASQTSQNAKPF